MYLLGKGEIQLTLVLPPSAAPNIARCRLPAFLPRGCAGKIETTAVGHGGQEEVDQSEFA